MNKLFRSRRFWLAVFGLAQAVIFQYVPGIPDAVWQSLLAVVMAAIIALTVDDTGKKIARVVVTSLIASRSTSYPHDAASIVDRAIEAWDK